VHRVDHFLGKSTVLNILGPHFANRVFEPVLNAAHVAVVEIRGRRVIIRACLALITEAVLTARSPAAR
jgi:hypothetical protein